MGKMHEYPFQFTLRALLIAAVFLGVILGVGIHLLRQQHRKQGLVDGKAERHVDDAAAFIGGAVDGARDAVEAEAGIADPVRTEPDATRHNVVLFGAL